MIFVDANVVLEVIQKRAHADNCERMLRNREEKAISTLTLDLVMYFIERDKMPWESIKVFLESFSWLPLTDADAQWAFLHFRGKDFEDALQVSCAIREGCSLFATLDKALAKKYSDLMLIEDLN